MAKPNIGEFISDLSKRLSGIDGGTDIINDITRHWDDLSPESLNLMLNDSFSPDERKSFIQKQITSLSKDTPVSTPVPARVEPSIEKLDDATMFVDDTEVVSAGTTIHSPETGNDSSVTLKNKSSHYVTRPQKNNDSLKSSERIEQVRKENKGKPNPTPISPNKRFNINGEFDDVDGGQQIEYNIDDFVQEYKNEKNNIKKPLKHKGVNTQIRDGKPVRTSKNTPLVDNSFQGETRDSINEFTNEFKEGQKKPPKTTREQREEQIRQLNMQQREVKGWNPLQILTGTGDERHFISGRKTRQANMIKANDEIDIAQANYIFTGEGSGRATHYDKHSYWAKVSGEGKKAQSTNSTTFESLSKTEKDLDTANDVKSYSAIFDFMKESPENAIAVGMGALGIGLVGAELLDES